MSLTTHYEYQNFVFVNVRSQFLEYAIHELACCTQNNFISVFVLVEQLVELLFATAKRYFLAFGSEAYLTLRKTLS